MVFLVLATKSISLVSCLTLDNCWWRCVEFETMLLFSLFPCCRVMTQGLILVLFLLLFKSLGKMNKICYWCLGVLSFCLANIWQSCILFIRLQPLKKVSLMRGFDLSQYWKWLECFGYSCGREQTSIHQPFINDFLCLIFSKEEPGVVSYDQWMSLYPSNKSSLEKEAKDNTFFTVWWVKSIEVLQAQSIGLSGQLALFTRTGEAILICFTIWFASLRFMLLLLALSFYKIKRWNKNVFVGIWYR